MALRILSHLGGDVPDRIREVAPDAEVIRVHGAGDLPDDLDGDVLVTLAPKHLPNLAEVLAAAPALRWVHCATTGIDEFPVHLVPEAAVLTCNRGASAAPISEWAMAAMLAFEKRFPELWLDGPPEAWNMAELGTLEGKHLGLVGWGSISQALARRALPFGVQVQAYRRRAEPSGMDGVEIVDSVEQLTAWADHLVIAAAATPETHHLVDATVLEAAKPGLHLVNVARGSLLDQDALRTALDDGIVARASLDVCEPEPLPEGHWLYEHPDVRLTAHVSWNTPAALSAIADPFLENLARFVAGEPVHGEVDRTAGY